MKKYKVNVNGTVYEVAIEVMDGAAPVAAAPAAAPPPAPPPTPGGEKGTAPKARTNRGLRVANGAAVKKGDILFILEAMKMENEIMAPCNGTAASVSVTKGAAVDSGALLCVIG